MSQAHAPKNLTLKILIAMSTGILLGIIFNTTSFNTDGFVMDVLIVGGKIFIASLKLLVVPLVFVSLVCGTAALDDIKKLGRVGGWTLGLYLLTTAIAISLALIAGMIIQPGAGFDLISATAADFAAKDAPPLKDTL
ncbi:dicarboxylate/amino acid:cation symporter, partial [bacterium]|nr:dicarboxylate/amino acid:cation symporter [bacterium]